MIFITKTIVVHLLLKDTLLCYLNKQLWCFKHHSVIKCIDSLTLIITNKCFPAYLVQFKLSKLFFFNLKKLNLIMF